MELWLFHKNLSKRLELSLWCRNCFISQWTSLYLLITVRLILILLPLFLNCLLSRLKPSYLKLSLLSKAISISLVSLVWRKLFLHVRTILLHTNYLSSLCLHIWIYLSLLISLQSVSMSLDWVYVYREKLFAMVPDSRINSWVSWFIFNLKK